jgi:hypothetical protein
MVETAGIRQVIWLVMLKSAKEQILGVDPPEQKVPPCVHCGMACLLIRGVVGSGMVIRPSLHGAREAMVPHTTVGGP